MKSIAGRSGAKRRPRQLLIAAALVLLILPTAGLLIGTPVSWTLVAVALALTWLVMATVSLLRNRRDRHDV